MNIAGRYDLICDQGSTLQRTFLYLDGNQNPIDNTGWLVRMQVRPKFRVDLVYLDLSTVTGEIVLGGADGRIEVTADAGLMENIKQGNHVYDLEVVTATQVFKIVRGNFIVRPEVTR